MEERLRASRFQSAPNSEALLDAEATAEAVEAALGAQFVLWAQMGHGAWDAEGQYLYLALAGDGKLPPQPIARRQWTHHPVVHYDCCVVGATRAQGGGRFDGHPTAALLAGASCVLSSVHPLFDRYAAEFSDRLYAKALWTMRTRCLWAQRCCKRGRRWRKNMRTTRWCGL